VKRLFLVLIATCSFTSAVAQTFDRDEVLVVSIRQFAPQDVEDKLVGSGTGMWATGTRTVTGEFWAPVHLPNGAVVTGVELDHCRDNSMTASSVSVGLYELCTDTYCDPEHTRMAAVAPPLSSIGCARTPSTVTPARTVNNRAHVYYLRALFGGMDGTGQMNAVRVFYRRAIAPPPATPSFGDVPTTSPYYAAIEALYADGGTAGCGNGNFCPGANVTREQLAAIIAKILGLGW
jgi:hypothetical protein